MGVLIGLVFSFFLALLCVPVLVILVQVLAAIYGTSAAVFHLRGRRPRIGVVVPAHNEATVIGRTLDCLKAQLASADRLIVVADNCTDETARVARTADCEVHERQDAQRRGKGYALDFGVRRLADDPPDIVIIVDADCLVEDGALQRLANASAATGRPAQALYLMHPPQGTGLMGRITAFAWLVKNRVRPLGFHHLGLPCHLMGTGMAFPWSVISSARLASGHIVEDLKLGADLARAGTPPLFCPQARVSSYFPTSAEGTTNQRTRWEHGHLGMILSDAIHLLRTGITKRDASLLALALDLCVPPLALLALCAGSIFIASLVFYLVSGLLFPLVLATGMLGIFTVAIVLAWWHFGRHVVSFCNLLMATWYAVRKMPLYLKFIVHRQMDWVRSKRDAE